jgi:hypothetical protein
LVHARVYFIAGVSGCSTKKTERKFWTFRWESTLTTL